ncbi:helix-turn-helix transcriptional regulator [Cryomorphaceae bacterium]|nr:helix-turn-helix transcriptional regulator [Cryomorphaceae bacterium]
MKSFFRTRCPITSALDLVGDKWSLVIVKQMLLEGRFTFKDFTEGDEGIATNILSSRLKMLEEFGVVQKLSMPNNKKSKLYVLTEKGLSLTPIIMELTFWSRDHLQDVHPNLNDEYDLTDIRKNKEETFARVIERYRSQAKELTDEELFMKQ